MCYHLLIKYFENNCFWSYFIMVLKVFKIIFMSVLFYNYLYKDQKLFIQKYCLSVKLNIIFKYKLFANSFLSI